MCSAWPSEGILKHRLPSFGSQPFSRNQLAYYMTREREQLSLSSSATDVSKTEASKRRASHLHLVWQNETSLAHSVFD